MINKKNAIFFTVVLLILGIGCALSPVRISRLKPTVNIGMDEKIPLTVAVVFKDNFPTYTHKMNVCLGIEINDKPVYTDFSFPIGETLVSLLQEGLPLVFERVIINPTPDQQAAADATLFPLECSVRTSSIQNCVSSKFKSAYKPCCAQCTVGYGFKIKSKYDRTIFESQKQEIIEEIVYSSAKYCKNAKIYKSDMGAYEGMIATAQSRIFSGLVTEIRSSKKIASYVTAVKSIALAAASENRPIGESWESSIIYGIDLHASQGSLTAKPFEAVRRLVQEKVNDHLTPRKPMNIAAMMPALIGKPLIPEPPKMKKSEFETKAMFEERVAKAMTDRKADVDRIQKDYRTRVEARNQTVQKLEDAFKADFAAIVREQEEKKARLEEYVLKVTREAFLEVMGEPIIENPSYDAESETMYVDFRASKATYGKRLAVKVPLWNARSFKENIGNAQVMALFKMNDNSISLNDVRIVFGPVEHEVMLTNEDFSPEKVEVEFVQEKVSFDASQQLSFDLQNPNLNDTYRVSAIQYVDGKSLANPRPKDDLPPLIRKCRKRTADPQKWLFIIAIEDYDETFDVPYARNSAKAFKEVAQKAFGISESRTCALIDKSATSGSIQDRMLTNWLEQINDGDTIYFYYCGHGVPDPVSSEVYLLPKDRWPDLVLKSEQFKLSTIYGKLCQSKAARIFSFIDACFSGKTDNNKPLFAGTAFVGSRPKATTFDHTKMVVMTAAKGTQFANSYDKIGHRLFTYYLIRALLDAKRGDVTGIYENVAENVRRVSWEEKGDIFLQEPQITGNTDMKLF